MGLRPYQAEGKAEIYASWAIGHQNVVYVLPTGGGKTVLLSDIIKEHDNEACVIAHRQELVFQISMALARDGVQHFIIGPDEIYKLCVSAQIKRLGRNYVTPNAKCAVAGVDTLPRRENRLSHWLKKVTLWVQDECHHISTTSKGQPNKWMRAVNLFPNAKGLGVTATPLRADGRGLGRHADGVFDTMVEGPEQRWLINDGYLCDYHIVSPTTFIDTSGIKISSSTGDLAQPGLIAATRKSTIVVFSDPSP